MATVVRQAAGQRCLPLPWQTLSIGRYPLSGELPACLPAALWCAGQFTCQGFPGSRGHEREDAQAFADWGAWQQQYRPLPVAAAAASTAPALM